MLIRRMGGWEIGTQSPKGAIHISRPVVGYGTVSTTAGSPTVTGVGTRFLSDFNQGGTTITINGETKTVYYITSD